MRFRTRALSKRRQADQLDSLPEVAKPRGWLAALALAVVVFGVVGYALAGEIPRRVTAEGVLGSKGGLIEVQSGVSGEVERVLVTSGENVQADTPLVEVDAADGSTTRIPAGFEGRVLEVRTAPGRVLSPGSDVVTLAGEPGEEPDRAYLFLSQDLAAGVAPGMEADINVSSAPQEAFGTVRGTVESVNGAPISPQQIDVLVSNDELVQQFTAEGAPVLATVRLNPADTPTGIEWAGGSGPEYGLRPGTPVEGDVQQGEQSVLDVVLGDR